ncbi:MAG TPA: response regulator [Opitutaceae bacterium]|nr:response regulator [Opitutaceae bacterium]
MHTDLPNKNRRILIIDDNRAIHEDFRKILMPKISVDLLAQAEADIFGDPSTNTPKSAAFNLESAYQGQEGVELARKAAASGQPFALAFVDMRMPPGWDGVETTLKLWEVEPDLQIVICSAYSDYSWEDLVRKIGQSDRLVILKKPFDNVEVLQLSLALTEKWHLLQQSRLQLETLQRLVAERTAELRAEIAVRKHAEEEAHEAQQAAEAASRSKSAFLANMSHEIRTPMNGILGMANLLLETGLSSEQRDFAEILRNSSETLMGILNNILDFSKIEADRLTLETTEFDLWEVVESAIELHAERAAQKKLELITQVGEEVPALLRGDPARLRQVLLNLVGNAIKFTSRGEVFLDVSIDRQDDATADVRFEVHDTGIGIAAGVLPHLFQPFTQADESTTRRYGGTGLGLAISRRIVEAMGGSVNVRSTAGQGSVFFFTVSFLKQAAAETCDGAERASLKGLRALVVDDNDTNRQVLHHQLNRWCVGNLAVADGPAALEALRAADASGDAYDVVLLDMQMPEMDGLMVAEAIKIAKLSRQPRLVMLTSMGDRLNAAERTRHGLDACLVKPVKHSHLIHCLASVGCGTRRDASRSTESNRRPNLPTASPEPAPTLFVTGSESVAILVAEDNAVNQKVAQLQLKKLGLSADMVSDGRQALRALRQKPYRVVLMDCQMPHLDGFEATRLIRADEAAGKATWPVPLHIIAMTASAMQGDREACLAAGMNDYISKPVALPELITALSRQISGHPLAELAPNNVVPMAI